jgi:foldase protein PrsA
MRTLLVLSVAASLSTVALQSPASAQHPALPPGAVALVGTEPIPQTEFDHWLAIALPGGPGATDPPGFERCIAAGRRRAHRAGRRPPRRLLRKRCEQRYESARRETMSFLVQGRWVRHEAAAREIAVAPERVRRSFERQRSQSFESRRAYRRFLRATGFSEAELLVRVELDLLQRRITAAVVRAAPPVTGDDVRRYYAEHRRVYRGKPRRRALRVVRGLLTARRQMRAIGTFVQEFSSRSRAMTVCARGYVVAECGSTASPPAE